MTWWGWQLPALLEAAVVLRARAGAAGRRDLGVQRLRRSRPVYALGCGATGHAEHPAALSIIRPVRPMYVPDQVVLERYARLLVEFALGGGDGIEPGDVVQVNGNDACKPLYVEACRAVWRAGGHVIHAYMPSADEYGDVQRGFYELASDEQLEFLPETVHARAGGPGRPRPAALDARPTRAHSTASTRPSRCATSSRGCPCACGSRRRRTAANSAGRSRGTPRRAWRPRRGCRSRSTGQQIIKACFLDLEDPVARWREVRAQDRRLPRPAERAADRAAARRGRRR